MSKPTFRDLELLSTYLDRELNQKEKTRLVARIVKEPELAKALDEMRQTRNMLRQTPHRRAPRNFTLTPKMAGIRPPVPRVVPALSWASAVAMLLFICTLGYNFLSVSGFGAAAPRAADNYGIANSAPATSAPAAAAPATAAPATMAPALAPYAAPYVTDTATPEAVTQITPNSAQRPKGTATEFSQSQQSAPHETPTPTPEMVSGMGSGPEEATATGTPTATSSMTPEPTIEALTVPNPSTPVRSQSPRVLPWAYIWLGLAALLVGTALFIRWWSKRTFTHKIK